MVIETCWWFSPCSLFSPSISLKLTTTIITEILWKLTLVNIEGGYFLELMHRVHPSVLVNCVLWIDRLVVPIRSTKSFPLSWASRVSKFSSVWVIIVQSNNNNITLKVQKQEQRILVVKPGRGINSCGRSQHSD
jgi:hypothetical protein